MSTGRVRCTPDPYVETLSNVQDHWTHTTKRSVSVRCSLSETLAFFQADVMQITGHANSVWPPSDAERPVLPARNKSAPDTQVQRPVPPRPASGEYFSSEKHFHDFSKLFIGAIENMHFIFSKAPNQLCVYQHVQVIKRGLGERNPNPSLSFNLHLLLKVCQHHYVCTNMCKCVSIFINIFFEGVKSAH